MTILQIIGVALLVAFLILILREQKPVFAMMLAVAAGVLLFVILTDHIQTILQMLKDIARRANVQPVFVQTLLKMVGIAYVCELAAQSLRDAGLESIAAKVELAGKVFILVLALPIMQMILDTILKLLEK